MFQHGSRNEYTVQQPFSWLKKAILVVAIAGFIAVIWYAAANRDNLSSEELNPSLVQAPSAPMKERPDAPGGMEVPHRDKKVFNLLEEDPESAAAAAEKAEQQARRVEQQAEEKVADIEQQVQAAEAQIAAEEAQQEVAETPTPAQASEPDPAPAPEAAPVPSVEPTTGWGVQLGSFRSRGDAKKAIDIFNKKFETMLDGLTPVIREAQLSQGTFHRVTFVGLESGEAARNLCSAFKQRNQGCLHVNLK